MLLRIRVATDFDTFDRESLNDAPTSNGAMPKKAARFGAWITFGAFSPKTHFIAANRIDALHMKGAITNTRKGIEGIGCQNQLIETPCELACPISNRGAQLSTHTPDPARQALTGHLRAPQRAINIKILVSRYRVRRKFLTI